MLENYFDNAATTPIDPRVVEAMRPWLSEGWGNAHSLHEPGRRAMAAVDRARESVAALLGCSPEEVFFTSGATEANNWVLRGHPGGFTTPFEHSSVLEPAEHLGFVFLGNSGYELGTGPIADTSPPAPSFELGSVMLVNNETGAIFRPLDYRQACEHLHSDITQGLGKVPISLDELDYASFSAHKLYGPKGIGGLYARDGVTPEPLLLGGEQEHGRRAGTLNVAAIAGFGEAALIAAHEQEADLERAQSFEAILKAELEDVPDHAFNDSPQSSPFIQSVSFLGVEGETLVIELDAQGFAVSAGAACSSRSTEPSHVLTALGLPTQWLRGTVRISFGRFNTADAVLDLAVALKTTVEKIRRKH